MSTFAVRWYVEFGISNVSFSRLRLYLNSKKCIFIDKKSEILQQTLSSVSHLRKVIISNGN